MENVKQTKERRVLYSKFIETMLNFDDDDDETFYVAELKSCYTLLFLSFISASFITLLVQFLNLGYNFSSFKIDKNFKCSYVKLVS